MLKSTSLTVPDSLVFRGFYAGESYAFTLLYGKFRLHADKMKQLMTDIEQRHEKGPE